MIDSMENRPHGVSIVGAFRLSKGLRIAALYGILGVAVGVAAGIDSRIVSQSGASSVEQATDQCTKTSTLSLKNHLEIPVGAFGFLSGGPVLMTALIGAASVRGLTRAQAIEYLNRQ